MIAHGGNRDVQYIENTCGAVEYVALHAAKSEEPDAATMRNIFIKKLLQLSEASTPITHRERLNAVANAVIASTRIG